MALKAIASHSMTYIPDLYQFLTELSVNNNREWFKENKNRFDDLRQLWTTDIERTIAHITEWWPEIKGQTAKSSIFRIYRDTRFSLDKSPYKPYFSAQFSPYGKGKGAAHMPGLYLHMEPDQPAITDGGSGLYGGMWCPEPAVLKKIRKAIVYNIEEFEEIINNPELTALYPDWWGDRLKTVPKGYDKNHPQAELLRLKEYGRFHHEDEKFFNDPAWPEKVSDRFRPLKPLISFLDYSIKEETT